MGELQTACWCLKSSAHSRVSFHGGLIAGPVNSRFKADRSVSSKFWFFLLSTVFFIACIKMLGEQQGSPMEHAPPWSFFSDREIGRSFSDVYPADGISATMNCGRMFPLPVSGVSIPQGSTLMHGSFSGGFNDDGYCGSDSPVGALAGFRSEKEGNEYSLLLGEALSSLQRFLPSNNEDQDSGMAVDAYSCDEFRMYDFKVRRCVRGRSHDWTECPYAHPGEKARRRDPRKFHYSGTACPDFRKGSCRRGDNCEFAHGVFECWLHPARYRTQPCKDGTNCRRRVCFFAHTPEQLRVLPQNPGRHALTNLHCPTSPVGDTYDGSPLRQALTAAAGNFDGGYFSKPGMISSPTSTLVNQTPHSPPPLSPPLSPPISPPLSPDSSLACAFSPHQRQFPPNTMNGVLASLRNLQINRAKSTPWSPAFNSPRASNLRPVFNSLPSTPTQTNWVDIWDTSCAEEEPAAERVESGRDLRAKIFAKLSKQNSVEKPEAPDVGWVSELVK